MTPRPKSSSQTAVAVWLELFHIKASFGPNVNQRRHKCKGNMVDKAGRSGKMILVGNKLRDLRKQHGMTQMELAEKLDVSRQTISKWEQGIARPSAESLISIGKLFDISVDDLINENPRSQEDAAATEEKNSAEDTKKFQMQKHWILIATAFALLTVIASVGIIRFSALRRLENDPIRLDDMMPEQIDPSEVIDGSDGWTVIEE